MPYTIITLSDYRGRVRTIESVPSSPDGSWLTWREFISAITYLPVDYFAS